MSEGRRELLERYGALYGTLGLALTFTRTNDPRKGDPKQGRGAGAEPSRSPTRPAAQR